MLTTTRKLTAAWPLVITLLLPALARAETAVQAWAQHYQGSAYSAAQAAAVAVDGSSNVIVTGYSMGAGSLNDYTTIKYSSAGVPLWTNLYNGPANGPDQAKAMAVDGNNDVIVTGYSYGSGSAYDYATIKYSSAGAPLWTNRYNGPGNYNDSGCAVAVDSSNNVIVTGNSQDSGSVPGYATIKYSSAGVPLWTNRYTGPGNSGSWAAVAAVDGSNNVIVTGTSYGIGSSYDYATIEYSSEGVPLWTNRYNGPGNDDDEAKAVAVDGSNSVIVTGYSLGNGSSYDYATIKYSSAGEPLWTNRYNGPANNDDQAFAVAADSSNNVIVTGYSYRGVSGNDYATIKYSGAGVPLWTNYYAALGNTDDQARAVVVDGNNNVFVTGSAATIKYSSAGLPLWTKASSVYAYAAALDRSGSVIIAGTSIPSQDLAITKYICVPSPVMTCLQLTNGTCQMRVDGVLQPGTLVIEACTNLAGWAPVFTNTTPTNVLFYTDPGASNSPARFYRAFQLP